MEFWLRWKTFKLNQVEQMIRVFLRCYCFFWPVWRSVVPKVVVRKSSRFSQAILIGKWSRFNGVVPRRRRRNARANRGN